MASNVRLVGFSMLYKDLVAVGFVLCIVSHLYFFRPALVAS